MSTPVQANPAIEEQLRDIVKSHFDEAHRRVPAIYKAHFSSPKAIVKRHWRHLRDVPNDFLTIPKSTFQFAKKALIQTPVARYYKAPSLKKEPQEKLSGKEQAILLVIQDELLQIRELTAKLEDKVKDISPSTAEIEAIKQHPFSLEEIKAIEAFLKKRLQSYTLPREGSRDLLLFLTIGFLGKGLGQKAVFGSSIATGAALAQSLYLSHQSWWGALWLQWAGTPAWISTIGALGGISLALVLAPALSPIAEICVNRVRGEKHLHQLLDQLEQAALEHKADHLDIAGLFASYAQLAPDLLQLIKSLR